MNNDEFMKYLEANPSYIISVGEYSGKVIAYYRTTKKNFVYELQDNWYIEELDFMDGSKIGLREYEGQVILRVVYRQLRSVVL
jgi:hypothetical protein